MITVRQAGERGRTTTPWLDSRHTFSFNRYHDPRHMGFRALRVINDDRVRPGTGFGSHAHRDMEILTYVLEGALEHRDSLGTGSVIRPGEIQRMSAGTGISHSEWNHSTSEPVHFLQIWLEPAEEGLAPSYEQRRFRAADAPHGFTLVAAGDGRDGAVRIHQDADVFAAWLGPTDRVGCALGSGRHAWVQLARGTATLNGVALGAGDGAAVSGEARLEIASADGAELLLFDLA
ncbi:MAG: pirin family protein [Candidatus Rokubacteria bacterium]|nr:pirin family protein [Candidatus Rokubacteria bacterium]